MKKKIVVITTAEEAAGKDLSTEKSIEKSYSKDKHNLWETVVERGKKIEGGPIANSLTDEQIFQIVMRFPSPVDKQLAWDLRQARYRLFDEIGMMLTGRVQNYGLPEHTEKINLETAEGLAEVFKDCLDNEEVTDRESLYDCFFKKLKVKGIPPISFSSWNKLEEVE